MIRTLSGGVAALCLHAAVLLAQTPEPTEEIHLWSAGANELSRSRALYMGGHPETMDICRAAEGELSDLGNADSRWSTTACIGDPRLVREIEFLLNNAHYSVIHFTNGMHNFTYSERQYADALPAVMDALKDNARSAKVIWATSMPTLDETKRERVRERNRLLLEALSDDPFFEVNDLYELTRDHPEYFTGSGYGLTTEGMTAVGQQTASYLRPVLEAAAEQPEPDYRLYGGAKVSREQIEWSSISIHKADQSSLPRVLFVGNSIVRGCFPTLMTSLEDQAYCTLLATSFCIADPGFNLQLGLLLQEHHYDVIHFNNGLHGWGYTEAEYDSAYGRTLRYLQENSPESEIIVGLTTPDFNKPDQDSRIDERNESAVRHAEENNLTVNDLNMVARLDPSFHAGDGVHYHGNGIQALSAAMLTYVSEALEQRAGVGPQRPVSGMDRARGGPIAVITGVGPVLPAGFHLSAHEGAQPSARCRAYTLRGSPVGAVRWGSGEVAAGVYLIAAEDRGRSGSGR